MLFNSFEFTWFLPLVFALYWAVPKQWLKLQNALLLLASYVFYGWWDYRFLALIAFSTVIDYWVAKQLHKTPYQQQKKYWLGLSIAVNLGILGYFKYANFFIESTVVVLQQFGLQPHVSTLQVILPVGISFYTFQTLSYTIDVYKQKLQPSESLLNFATYVSFFPQLVAGPIERATHLLPQIQQTRVFNAALAIQGVQRIIWGLVKKVVVADQLAPIVNQAFGNAQGASSFELGIAAVYFAFQIYGDFSGYSNVAIGTAQLFGIQLKENFRFPYLATNISDFWHRWHISLSTWFRDYVYIPLGGSKHGQTKALRNIMVIFLVSGFWHGANFTFIVWGAIHAVLYLPLFILGNNRKHLQEDVRNPIKHSLSIVYTFSLVTLAWIFFRADSISQAIEIYSRIFQFSGPILVPKLWWLPILLIALEVIMQCHQLLVPQFNNRNLNVVLYASLLLLLVMNATNDSSTFIYFQF